VSLWLVSRIADAAEPDGVARQAGVGEAGRFA
jgi:hypothetical protein